MVLNVAGTKAAALMVPCDLGRGHGRLLGHTSHRSVLPTMRK